MVTMAEVAARAGVSTSTVSHVLNKTRPVSEVLASRVHAAILDSGYSPNALARSLATSSTKLVGIVMSATTNPFFATAFSAMEGAARLQGFSVVLSDSHDDPLLESEQVRVMLDHQVSGLILAPAGGQVSAALLDRLHERSVPVALVDRFADARFDSVGAENVESTAMLVTHLAEAGHRRIGLLAGRPGLSTTSERCNGYRLGLRRAGLRYDPKLVRSGGSRWEPAQAATKLLLAEGDPPTALVSANNDMTLGALRALRDAALGVPEDIAVVGYDDLAHGDLIQPGLTVAAQPIREIGRCALEMLLERMKDWTSPVRHRRIEASFVHRSSCGCPAPTG